MLNFSLISKQNLNSEILLSRVLLLYASAQALKAVSRMIPPFYLLIKPPSLSKKSIADSPVKPLLLCVKKNVFSVKQYSFPAVKTRNQAPMAHFQ